MSCPHPGSSTPSDLAMQGRTVMPPEWCRNAGYRGTGCVHCARPGLWGGRLGNHWLYPETDCLQPTLRCGFRQRLKAGVRCCRGMAKHSWKTSARSWASPIQISALIEGGTIRKDITFNTEDGVPLRAWFYQPDNAAGPFPTI